jgi:hypothetical protein
MLILPKGADDEQIRQAVRGWIEVLAQDRYDEAFSMLFRYRNDPWTPELMRNAIANYGCGQPQADGRVFRVTPPGDAIQRGSRKRYEDVEWFEDGEGVAHFDLPLNGEWSDVTAVLDILPMEDGLVLRLNAIEVL